MTAEVHSPDSAKPSKCHACDGPMNTPVFCSNCQTLQPADGLSYYDMLGLPPKYDLEPAEVRQAYLKLSRDIHPDRFNSHSPEDAAQSVRISAQSNRAYQVLSDPVLRAEYLLELTGGKSAQDDKSVPSDVLTQVMMLREELDEARADQDDAALADARRQVQARFDQTLTQIGDLARELPGTDDSRQTLRTKLNTIKYYQKLLEDD